MPLACRLLVLGLSFALSGIDAYAATAGTVISNTAELSFDVEGTVQAVPSNTVRTVVAERLDVAVAADVPSMVVQGAGEHVIGFRVANMGNGAETFTLAATVQGSGASVLRVAADEDDDGIYDPADDRALPNGQVALDAGRDAGVFVIVGGFLGGGEVSLAARAATGTGPRGTAFVGLGQGGGDAVVGSTGAIAVAQTLLTAPSREASLLKSQSVVAPDGSSRAVKGAVITYSLDASFPQAASAVEIADTIPAGTAYLAGSLTLDGTPLSDIADADPGAFRNSAITVALGDIAAGSRTIRFQVTIQ